MNANSHPMLRDLTLKDAALASGAIDERRFDEIVDPQKLVGHGVGGS
jgi:fumarate hydratase, class II